MTFVSHWILVTHYSEHDPGEKSLRQDCKIVGVGSQSQNPERLRDDADPQSALPLLTAFEVGWIKRIHTSRSL
jgi:hypothetical protein